MRVRCIGDLKLLKTCHRGVFGTALAATRIAEEPCSFVAARYVAIDDAVVAGANSCRDGVLPNFVEVLFVLELRAGGILAGDMVAPGCAAA